MRSLGSLVKVKTGTLRDVPPPSLLEGQSYPNFFQACDSLLACTQELSCALSEGGTLSASLVRSFLSSSKVVMGGLKYRQEEELKEALKTAREAVTLVAIARKGGRLSDEADLVFLGFALEELVPLLGRFH